MDIFISGIISQVNVYDFAMTAQEVKLLWRNCANNVGNVRAWPEFAGGIVGRLEKKSTRFCLPCPDVQSDDGTVVNKVVSMQVVCHRIFILYRYELLGIWSSIGLHLHRGHHIHT